MSALKFLSAGAVSPFTGFRWPAPGTWVAAPEGRGEAAWIHACRPRDLPSWLDEELWWIELAGPVRASRWQVAAPRARLLERVAAWDGAAREEYARACAQRARDLALPTLPPALRAALGQLESPGPLAAAARAAATEVPALGLVADAAERALGGLAAPGSYIACTLAARLAGTAEAFDAERAWQAAWLCARLAIDPDGAFPAPAGGGARPEAGGGA